MWIDPRTLDPELYRQLDEVFTSSDGVPLTTRGHLASERRWRGWDNRTTVPGWNEYTTNIYRCETAIAAKFGIKRDGIREILEEWQDYPLIRSVIWLQAMGVSF